MISIPSFFDEIEKIAAEEAKYITKDKLKRLLPVMLAAGAGTGAGYATGQAIKRYTKPSQLRKVKSVIPRKLRPFIGTAVGGMLGGYVGYRKRKLITEYIEGKKK